MWKQYFADHPAAPFGVLAMAIFMTLFFCVLVYVWRKPRAELSDVARLPLVDDARPFGGKP